jgi:competence protein ComEC
MALPLGFVLSAAFLLGVALEGSGLFAPVFAFLAGSIALARLWVADNRILLVGGAFLLFMLLGMARVSGEHPYPPAPDGLDEANTFVGVVIDVPSVYPTATYTRIDVSEPIAARVWSRLPVDPSVAQGDIVRTSGAFTPNERTSFRGFAAQRDTAGVLNAASVQVIGNEATWLEGARTSVAGEIRARLRVRVPEPAGAFATGVILGDDGAMTESTRHSFRVGGLTHMTAVSGVHVGIIAGALLLVSRLGLVSRWWMLGASVPIIWSFAFLVGMRPSVVRASLMLTLLLIAHFLGRPRDTLNAIGLAAGLMVVVEPTFRHDIGFQLSVAATLGIAIGAQLVGRRSYWHLLWVVPTSAQLATEPLILYHFGYYSIVSPFANILATPFLAATMATSMLTVAASFVSATIADALAIAAWAPATAVVGIADLAAGIPYLSDDIQPISLTTVWSLYAVLGALVAILFVVLEPAVQDDKGDFSMVYRV